ncbi:MAG: hypothetical protein HZB26_13780 [Candidatus Hydrogenedentes bacterium]|nr:hypothetical protein [Candidatus Hydrogenedentota bacterium]
MPITLGSIVLDATHTSAAESYAEVGGRDARKITLSGLILGEPTAVEIEARLDAILDAASAEDYGVALSVRADRQLWVRRESFERAFRPDELIGSFTLVLEARDPFEYATTPSSHSWTISASGATLALTSAGNAHALPSITLVAAGTIINPAFGDGTRSIQFSGTVAAGQTLVFDAPSGRVTLDGVDVTPYTAGEFPQIAPEGANLCFTDDAVSSHLASVTVSYNDRWW